MLSVLKGLKTNRRQQTKEFQIEEREIEQAVHPSVTDDLGLPLNSKRILYSRITVIRADNAEQAIKIAASCGFPRWGPWEKRQRPHGKKYRERCRMMHRKVTEV